MSGILEFFEDRYNIGTVDRSQFCDSDDTAACLIIIFKIDDLQILADRFQYQKLNINSLFILSSLHGNKTKKIKSLDIFGNDVILGCSLV